MVTEYLCNIIAVVNNYEAYKEKETYDIWVSSKLLLRYLDVDMVLFYFIMIVLLSNEYIMNW